MQMIDGKICLEVQHTEDRYVNISFHLTWEWCMLGVYMTNMTSADFLLRE